MGINRRTLWISLLSLTVLVVMVNILALGLLDMGDPPGNESLEVDSSPVGNSDDANSRTEIELEGFSGSGRGIISDVAACDNFLGECLIRDGICTIDEFSLPDEFYVCVDVNGDESYSDDEVFGPYTG